ncbi:MAG TPA: metalloregulator ArsR/SmtB family transcription factor [Polyangiaceae bacterium]|nr:metalloregulator ArsR/SmtB family transcription factor [Polyangiaceae bacterium]
MASLLSAVSLLQLFAEPTRVRLMALLEEHELTVAELVGITELGQSSVSTHLGKLRDAGLLRDRRAGASTLYALNDGSMPQGARQVWSVVKGEIKDAVLDGDRARCAEVLRARERARAWPDAVAGQMERHYSPGRTWEAVARGLFGLVRLGDVLDAGAGDGSIAQLLAPRAKSVTCLDRNEKMVQAARARLSGAKNAAVCAGDVHELPFGEGRFDHVLLFNVLTQAATPARAVAEAARVLREGGGLTVITLGQHEHAAVTASYGDLHPGFSPPRLRRMLQKAGLAVDACDVACREKRPPHFETVTAFAHKGP